MKVEKLLNVKLNRCPPCIQPMPSAAFGIKPNVNAGDVVESKRRLQIDSSFGSREPIVTHNLANWLLNYAAKSA